MSSSGEAPIDKNVDWDEVVKKEARGINYADFGEVQLTIGDTVITEKGIADQNRFYLPKSLVNKFDGHTLWFNITKGEANNTYRNIELGNMIITYFLA